MHKIKCTVAGTLAGFSFLLSHVAFGQDSNLTGQNLRAITTAVPILTVAPDARSAAMGDAGVALSPDVNASYWNPAKLGFLETDFAAGLSYSPWLRNIVNDMSLSYVSVAKKIGRNSGFSASLMYFNLGSIQFTDNLGNPLQDFRPKEYAISGAYGLRLSEYLSLGVGARFINSNLSGGVNVSGGSAGASRPGRSVAGDIGIYYNRDLTLGGKNYNMAFGGNLSNLGAKISYSTIGESDFLPTNLRLGTALTAELDPYNSLTLAVDGNKLLVPSPAENDEAEDLRRRQMGPLGGAISSFSDAPDGFSEEISEINLSTGVEYWYDRMFAARVGYFYEDPNKGNRQYFSLGLGLRYQKIGLDAAYLIPNSQNNPLANTVRFTLFFNLEAEEPAATGLPLE